jgi:hypothetical protein
LAGVKHTFYLDENFPVAVAAQLRRQGFVATTADEESTKGATDPFQLIFAADRGWVLVTHNRSDFRMLHEAWHLWSHRWGVRPQHAGILVVRVPMTHKTEDITGAIAALASHPTLSLAGALYEWHRSTGWVRFPG